MGMLEMTEMDQSNTTKAEPTEAVVVQPSTGATKHFTGVWDELTHANYTKMLSDLKTEAEAAIATGDQTLAKWARSTGTMASVLLTFLKHTDPAEFNKLAGVAEEGGIVGAEALAAITKEAP